MLEGVYDRKGPPEHESHVVERAGGLLSVVKETMADVFGLPAMERSYTVRHGLAICDGNLAGSGLSGKFEKSI